MLEVTSVNRLLWVLDTARLGRGEPACDWDRGEKSLFFLGRCHRGRLARVWFNACFPLPNYQAFLDLGNDIKLCWAI